MTAKSKFTFVLTFSQEKANAYTSQYHLELYCFNATYTLLGKSSKRPSAFTSFLAFGTYPMIEAHGKLIFYLLFVPDKKAACAILTGYVKVRQYSTVLECEIDCCRDANCNDRGKYLLMRLGDSSRN